MALVDVKSTKPLPPPAATNHQLSPVSPPSSPSPRGDDDGGRREDEVRIDLNNLKSQFEQSPRESPAADHTPRTSSRSSSRSSLKVSATAR